ncbi:kinase-like protein [Neocallimastix lanati (nom. inval.)]|jgi:serine/threonine protein kinase|uniref:non-specific serine/threonine protein kinase n=1 Tax=Neocallimastix californiae TaxID=1754190 RepID=A0A1Y2BI73_9FUNG|nr:kinase-like protein [Neocallimastix sp. JGI-2020a]ORY34489.1 kinase-like protein [Neocallimastix californiae]|eukprot:ORY34489.1 kinase-like protein [Neocallimastix californiae]
MDSINIENQFIYGDDKIHPRSSSDRNNNSRYKLVKQKTDDEIEINEIEPSSQNNKKIRRFSNYLLYQSDDINMWKNIKVVRQIGKGTTGKIFRCIDLNNNIPVAIKVENTVKNKSHLYDEFKMYKYLSSIENIPRVYDFKTSETNQIMVMELLGPSVDSMFRYCGNKFSMKTICMLAKRMITLLESVHKKGVVYRDIKPENFVVGNVISLKDEDLEDLDNDSSSTITNSLPSKSNEYRHEYKKRKGKLYNSLSPNFIDSELDFDSIPPNEHPLNQIYLLDFGLSEFFVDRNTHTHVQNRLRPPCGTPRYMSIRTHQFRQQSRRDDLESLGYLLLYFLKKGNLPWQGITATDVKSMIYRIWDKKESIPLEKLFKDCPEQFITYMKYSRNLNFTEKPDYKYMTGLFDEILQSINEEDDGIFDWYIQIQKEQERKDNFCRRLIYRIFHSSSTTEKCTSPSLLLDIQVNKNSIEKVTKRNREKFTILGFLKRKFKKLLSSYWKWVKRYIVFIRTI